MEKERDYLFDNLKVLLIFLVVFGHFSERYINKDIYLKNIYIFIYIFHMPLFIFISGYFSKSVEKCRKKAIQDLLIPFIFLNMVYYTYYHFTNAKANINIFNPGWTLWYLLSLFFWRFFLKDIIMIKKTSLVLCISVFLGLLVGIVDKNTAFLSFSRTFAFLPFFLIGYYVDSNLIRKIKEVPKILSMIGIILIGTITCMIINNFSLKYTILYLSVSYKDLGLTFAQGILLRSIFYVFSIVMCIFIINLMSVSEHKISQIGRKTMIIYIGHIYFIFLIRNLIPVYKSALVNDGITLVSAIIIVLILSLNIFEKVYNNFFRTINKILKINKKIKTEITIGD